MTRTITNRRYLDAIADHVVVFDGAMGTSLQKLNLTAADYGGEKLWGCNDYVVIAKPQVVEQVHASFLAAGCEVVETDTFRSNCITLGEYGLQDRVVEINRAAAELARRVCDRFARETGVPRYVAGSIGPTGKLPSSSDPTLSNITFQELADVFAEQARGLVEGGADLLIVETQQDILEVKAAIYGINRYFEQAGVRVPLQVQVTLDTTGRMLLGTDIAAVLAILEALPVDVVGLNCSTGPDYMREPVHYLTSHTRRPVSVIPNAGLPINVDGMACYPMEPGPMAETLIEFVTQLGVSVVGGCCGTTPEHLELLVQRVRQLAPRSTFHIPQADESPQVASAMRATLLRQEPPPHLIGERINTQGSKAAKQLLLADDYEGIVQIARDQVEGGAHTLDVCVALTERADESAQMQKVVKLLSQSVELPLVIDSTEADVIRAALEVCPGRPIINSINLENGRKRCDAILPLCRDYGAAVIALTIDEAGMAKSAQRKLEIARRIYDIAVGEYGLRPDALIFDALTFTLATGDVEFANSAIETLEGIRAIKRELSPQGNPGPGVLCSLGVSNLSFGLSGAARGPLNAVFLYHAVAAGLDMAIVNPKQAVPYAEIAPEVRELAEDLILNRRPDALPRYIAYFEEQGATGQERKTAAEPTAGMAAEQKLHWQIVHRRKEGVEALIDDCLTRNSPVWVLNNVLLPGMKEVGDKFGAGELILPYVLQSAEVMKKSVAHLERFLEKKEGVTKGKVVLATVYGDVHDIGKNLVGTILSNNGYTVFDLGKQVPASVVVDKAAEVGADAIGLSALLVSTSKQMPLVVQELDRRGSKIPVLIGGAAINRRFGWRILFVDDHAYAPGVFYCKDAFEGLETLDTLADERKRPALLARIRQEADQEMSRSLEKSAPQAAAAQWKPVGIPTAPFWGSRVLSSIPLSEVFPYLDKNELFRLSWGAKNAQGQEWDKLHAEFEERLSRMQSRAQHEGWLCPQAVYGYWPCNSDGNVLLVYEPAKRGQVIARFAFPRQDGQERLSVADYFAPVDSGMVDVVALQVVTVGHGATERFDALQAAGDYSEAYYTHGLAVQTAEATAEWLHRRIKKELGIGDRGKRYSWGYGACPDLEDHALVFKLLPAPSALDMSLTPAFQLVPEQSTAAVVVHHPDARYFAIGGSRVEQLMRGV